MVGSYASCTDQVAAAVSAYRVRRNVGHRRRMQHGSIAGEPRTVARAFHLVVLRDPGELAARLDQEQRRVRHLRGMHDHETACVRQLRNERERHSENTRH